MNKRGFTIIELLVIIVILSIIVLLALPKLTSYTKEAKLNQIKNDVKIMENKMEILLSTKNEEFENWENVQIDLKTLAFNNRLYETKGLARFVNEEFDYKIIPYSFRKESKLGGVFYANMNGKVYYSPNKGEPIDEKDPFYIPKTNVPYIKSATVIPYELWNVNMVRANVKRLNLNTINIPIRIEVDNVNSNNMKVNKDDLEHAKVLINKLDYLGVDFILEPFPWIAEGSVIETEWNPENIDTWFYNWKFNVLKPLIDEVGSPNNVEYLTVSNNFVNMEYATGYWTDLFSQVKNDFGYKGKVIYKTNWWTTASWDQNTQNKYNKKLNNSLFGDSNLDIISIAAYFEITNLANPTVDELKSGLRSSTKFNRNQDIYAEIRNFHWKWNKKVMFGELGVPSYDGYSSEPWNPYPTGFGNNYNKAAQYNYFKAYIETFTKHPTDNQDWFGGFSIFVIGDDTSPYKMKENNIIDYISGL